MVKGRDGGAGKGNYEKGNYEGVEGRDCIGRVGRGMTRESRDEMAG